MTVTGKATFCRGEFSMVVAGKATPLLVRILKPVRAPGWYECTYEVELGGKTRSSVLFGHDPLHAFVTCLACAVGEIDGFVQVHGGTIEPEERWRLLAQLRVLET